jgi:hypothetical protein
MIKQTIFGHPIYRFHCNQTELYTNRMLLDSVDRLLDLPEIQNRTRGLLYDSCYGEILTSAGNEMSDIENLPGARRLVEWITNQLLLTSPSSKTVEFTRTWCNKMFKDSEGLVHAHIHPDVPKTDIDFVAIFYLQSTEEYGNLVIVDCNDFNTRVQEYPEDKKISLPCVSGDLIVHDKFVHHGITAVGKTPRLIFAFEGTFHG